MLGAVDIGGTKIAVGIVDEQGRVTSRLESPTDARRGYAHALERMESMLRRTAQSAGVGIHGIGIGCTGPVDPFTGAIGEVEFLPGWRDSNPVDDLARKFGVPVAMVIDA
ncbi:MAG TPA: ROK family protein, partial [Acidobacteriota bacterium]|nr:ROK family protein [Acidobacteriota bacterium]